MLSLEVFESTPQTLNDDVVENGQSQRDFELTTTPRIFYFMLNYYFECNGDIFNLQILTTTSIIPIIPIIPTKPTSSMSPSPTSLSNINDCGESGDTNASKPNSKVLSNNKSNSRTSAFNVNYYESEDLDNSRTLKLIKQQVRHIKNIGLLHGWIKPDTLYTVILETQIFIGTLYVIFLLNKFDVTVLFASIFSISIILAIFSIILECPKEYLFGGTSIIIFDICQEQELYHLVIQQSVWKSTLTYICVPKVGVDFTSVNKEFVDIPQPVLNITPDESDLFIAFGWDSFCNLTDTKEDSLTFAAIRFEYNDGKGDGKGDRNISWVMSLFIEARGLCNMICTRYCWCCNDTNNIFYCC